MGDTDESTNINWNSEDEREIDEACLASSLRPGTETYVSCSSASDFKSQFIRMGFSEEMVEIAIEANGDNAEEVLDMLLTHKAIENIDEHGQGTSSRHHKDNSSINLSDDNEHPELLAIVNINEHKPSTSSGHYEDNYPVNLSNGNDYLQLLGKEEQDRTVSLLVEMGYDKEEVLNAVNRCGPDTPIDELADFIGAAQMVKEYDAISAVDDFCPRINVLPNNPRQNNSYIHKEKKRKLQVPKNEEMEEYMAPMRLPNPMIGYGVPGNSYACSYRKLPDAAKGPPYFYYENVALAPKGVWARISSFLYEVQPEFVDSAHICAANRKRGYIHNLPINNRFPLSPSPPKTIHEALPSTKKWWPSWDTRTKFNCLQTCVGSAKLTERISTQLRKCGADPPPLQVQKYVLEECRRWNLVWVRKDTAAPLEPSEMELVQRFPKDHTRGFSLTDRYKALGNTFQVDTVAYHLSVLKDMYPNGINVLSLFSGIGGAEVALHKLGIFLKNVVSIEISEINRQILRTWWEQTDQKGTLIEMEDVQKVTVQQLNKWSEELGGFDLVIGGSPCNNLAGSNRHTRNGLEGTHSSLFFEYIRILDHVRSTHRFYHPPSSQ